MAGNLLAAPPRTILVVVTRRIGDVLLATPLVRTLKHAWPAAAVDVLVFAGTEGVLGRNRDLRAVLTVPERGSLGEQWALVRRIRRRYDLALSTLPGDRPTLYAWLAGRTRVGAAAPGPKHAWKRALLTHAVPFDDRETHAVAQNLALARPLGIAPQAEVAASWSAEDERAVAAALPFEALGTRYAVLHLYPKFRYKQWTAAGWTELAQWLAGEGLWIVLTGSGAPDETEYVAQVAREFPAGTVNLAGRLSFPQAACLITRAAVYVGPDTGTTHLAAATGTPTIALFGPSSPVRWGPWPRGYDDTASPFGLRGSRTVNNVTLLQGAHARGCVPCLREGCERHVASRSDCLEEMPAARVIDAVRKVLARVDVSERAARG
ncbi:MAG: putative lipopolysaccharide heptosyltransferase III [Burkholderiales bacterium]|nr:putative lipopolysaccharide heptosyltransferase III [Burkholderiales bacterium]